MDKMEEENKTKLHIHWVTNNLNKATNKKVFNKSSLIWYSHGSYVESFGHKQSFHHNLNQAYKQKIMKQKFLQLVFLWIK